MKRRAIGCFAAASMVLALLGGSAGEAQAGFYGYAQQSTTGYSFTGATIAGITALTSSSASQTAAPSGSEAFNGAFDTLQSYVGPAPRPLENTFTPRGMVGPDYVRGDAIVNPGPVPAFGTNNVAEGFLNGPGISAGSGSWAVSSLITLAAPGTVSLSFSYVNQLTLINTLSGGLTGIIAADFGYTFVIQDQTTGFSVFTESPLALNRALSRVADGTTSSPGAGSVTITSLPLPAGQYRATISGSEHVFITAVPEPGSLTLAAISGIVLSGAALRKRFSGPRA